ncbi:unnamed protein product, partial [Ixodes hexagonus]
PPCELVFSFHTLQDSSSQVPQNALPSTVQAVQNASVPVIPTVQNAPGAEISTVQDNWVPAVQAVQYCPLQAVQAVQNLAEQNIGAVQDVPVRNVPALPSRLQQIRIRPVPLPQLPLETMAEFDQCELALADESTRVAMLEHMVTLGGTTLRNATRIAMERTLRNSVQTQLSLHGRRFPKIAFKGTKLCAIMCEAIHARTKEDIVQIERYLGRYLALASDRAGGRRQR